jgi:hypothetical protein
MGQQQETVAGNALRRIILVLTVAAVMAAMLAVNVTPAMADNAGNQPPGPPLTAGGTNSNGFTLVAHNSGGTCVAHSGDKSGDKVHGPGC